MKLFLPKYPAILKFLYPGRLSKVENKKAIYLTFDDGPIPEITPWVLDELSKFNAKATFFCIGDNVTKHPDIFRRIIQEGHAIGNHSFNHLNGWKTSTFTYIENILEAEKMLNTLVKDGKSEKINTLNSKSQATDAEKQTPNYNLFRPPYGKIKNSQARILKKQGYKIVLWDVISGDYDKDFSAERCFENVTINASAGSIIVLHDSKKAFKNLKILLPQLLEYYTERELQFSSLKDVL